MSTQFKATRVPILKLSRLPSEDGICIPPECYIQLPDKVPVVFDDANQKKVGYATLRRVGNTIEADLTITSSMKSATRALGLMQKLYPGTVFAILSAVEHVILGLRLTTILLGPHPNMDKKIKPLGDKVSCLTAKTDLH